MISLSFFEFTFQSDVNNTMLFVRHYPSRGHCRSFILQLHSFTGSTAGVDIAWDRAPQWG